MENLKTGDLLLFNNTGGGFFGTFTSIIKWGTHSNYSHIAMVLKDPTFIHPHLKGTYVWESSWEGTPDPQDGEKKLGVQITPIGEILDKYKNSGTVLCRKIECDKSHFTEENLSKVHTVVYKKPYDIVPLDWVEGFLQKDDSDWSIMRPCDFSLNNEKLNFCEGCSLEASSIKIQ